MPEYVVMLPAREGATFDVGSIQGRLLEHAGGRPVPGSPALFAVAELRELLGQLPSSPHAEIRVAVGGLMGYGLYDPGLLDLDSLGARMADQV